ncbi:hypothetical protein ACYZTL_09005 [Pseudomonas sp. LB3P81]
MTPSLLMAVLASGFIYGITPGVLAVFGIGAARGRRAGAGFCASICTALLSSRAELLHWSMLPWLIVLSFVGGLIAYAILIGIVGARQVRCLYQRHELAITRLCGVMFIGFAINALVHALPGADAEQGLKLIAGTRQRHHHR